MSTFMPTHNHNPDTKTLNEDDFGQVVQFESLVLKRNSAIESINLNKEHAEKICRKIPIQVLALEWLTRVDSSTETRAYLVENFLPVLVLGCEKLLKEANSKNLIAQNKKDPNFNPINVLAQYLMRNNPKYNNLSENSDYTRTMREVYQELREQLYSIQGNKLAKLKEDVRRRRHERERQEQLRQIELGRRRKQIEDSFQRFSLSPNGRLEIDLIIESFRWYHEHILSLPHDLRKLAELNLKRLPSYCYTRDEIFLEKRLLLNEFVQTILSVTDHFKSDIFNLFVEYFEECAMHFVYLANMNKLSRILEKLIGLIDVTKTGFLSRRRLLRIFDEFKQLRARNNLRNPFDWPVLDTFIKFENKLEDTIPPLPKLSIVSKTQELEVSLLDLTATAKVSPKSSKSSIEQDQAAAVASNSDLNRENTHFTVVETQSSNLDIKPSESELNASIIEPLAVTGCNGNQIKEHNQLERPNVTKKDELLFIKGGSLYYEPISSCLNAFDRTLLAENKENEERIENAGDLLTAFDPDLLTHKQSLNLINSFINKHFLSSEIHVNDLIAFIKDNYAESASEKQSKLEKMSDTTRNLHRNKKFSSCFDKIDNEGSGVVDLNILIHALVDYKDGVFKEQVLKATDLLKERIMVNGKPDDSINKNEFIKFLLTLIEMVNFPKFEDQVSTYLAELANFDYEEKTRGELRKTWLNQMKYVGEIVSGSLEPLYKQLFFTLLKDAESHGQSKNISAHVAILERVNQETVGLKYHATTPFDSQFVLGKVLTRREKSTSFKAIDNGKYEHVPLVRSNPNVHFFNSNNKNDGSFVVYPLKYGRNKVFGTIGVDTLQETSKNTAFAEHEISFYQGVASTFAQAYANIIFKNRFIKCCMNAIEWLNRRCTGIDFCNLYLVQLLDKNTNINEDILALNINKKKESEKDQFQFSLSLKPILNYRFLNENLENNLHNSSTQNRLENRLGSRAYECALNSETTVEYFDGNASFYVPIRNEEHKTKFVLEISSKNYFANSEKYEDDFEQIETVLYVLHKCQEALLDEQFLGSAANRYEFETLYEQDKFEILFEKEYMIHTLNKLEKHVNQELNELMPDGTAAIENTQTRNLLKLVADLLGEPEFTSSNLLGESLLDKLKNFDPTIDEFKFNQSTSKLSLNDSNEMHSFYKLLTRINKPLRLLIDWCCLIEHIFKKSSLIIQNYN